MTGFWALHLRRLRDHTTRTLLSLGGIAVGSALLVAVLALYGSLTGSIGRLGALAGPADVEIVAAADTGFDATLLAPVDTTPGVQAAVPMVRTSVAIAGQDVLLIGVDQRARALGAGMSAAIDRRVRQHADIDGVYLAPALARVTGTRAGARIRVRAGAEEHLVRVLGVLDEGLNGISRGMVAVAPLPVAQQLAGRPGRLDTIEVVAARGVSRAALEHRLEGAIGGRAVVTSPRLLARQAAAAAGPLRTGMLTVVAAAMVVAGFLVFNTMSMAALERRRELATLRALGGRRRALLAGFLVEAGLLGLVGSAAGAFLGVEIGRTLVDRLPSMLVSAFGVRVAFVLPGAAIPVAVGAGTAATLLAAALPARRAVRVAPVEAMRPEGVLESGGEPEPVRWGAVVAGLGLVGIGLACVLGFGGTGSVTAMFLVTPGALIAGRGLVTPLTAVMAWVASRFGTAGQLAGVSLGRAPRRAWAAASAVAISVGLVVATAGTERNTMHALRSTFAALAGTDLLVTSSARDDFGSGVLMPDAWADQLARSPGVARVVAGQAAFATVGRDRVLLQGVGGASNVPAFRLASPAARQAVLDGTAVVVTRPLAQHRHLHVGGRLTLTAPDGPRSLPIAGVVESFGWESGLVVLSLPNLQRWFARPGVTWLEITGAPSADRTLIRDAARAVVARAPFPVKLETGAQAVRAVERSQHQGAAIFDAMQWVVVGGAALAILNTLMLSVVERRRELGIMRAIGTSRRQLRRTVIGEAAVIGALGTGIGVVLGQVQHYAAVAGTRSLGGLPVHYRFESGPAVLALVAAMTASLAGAMLPAWRASRLNVIAAIGYE
jgi:putative ABC transport system permease protein